MILLWWQNSYIQLDYFSYWHSKSDTLAKNSALYSLVDFYIPRTFRQLYDRIRQQAETKRQSGSLCYGSKLLHVMYKREARWLLKTKTAFLSPSFPFLLSLKIKQKSSSACSPKKSLFNFRFANLSWYTLILSTAFPGLSEWAGGFVCLPLTMLMVFQPRDILMVWLSSPIYRNYFSSYKLPICSLAYVPDSRRFVPSSLLPLAWNALISR